MSFNISTLFIDYESVKKGVSRQKVVEILINRGLTEKQAKACVRNAIYNKKIAIVDGIVRKFSDEKNEIAPKKTQDHDRESLKGVIEYLNSLTGSKFKPTEGSISLIKARLDEGYTFEDIKRVIDLKVKEWLGGPMEKYLRPETLFNRTKFNSYAGVAPKREIDSSVLLEDIC